MSKLTYVGPHDAVSIAGVGVVKRGASFDAGALTDSLAAQSDNFAAVKPESKPEKKES